MSGWRGLGGTVSITVLIDVWDNRLGCPDVVEVEVPDVDFTGRYQYDPGVRYYPDGSGEPPSEDWEAELDGGFDDIVAEVGEDIDESGGRWTLLETRKSLLACVSEAIEAAIEDRVQEFVVESDYAED